MSSTQALYCILFFNLAIFESRHNRHFNKNNSLDTGVRFVITYCQIHYIKSCDLF